PPRRGRGRAVVVGRSGDLTLRWNRDARGRFLTLGVTALADHAERRIGSAALADGTVLAWAGSPDDRVPLGQAPWQITALAVSADGRRLAAVGGDSRMLVWGLGRSAPYEEVPLAFCADHVFAHPDGGWVVSGTGGPVELTTEDGRRHRITPVPDDTPEDGPPAWLRDAVLAEADRSGIASLLAEPSALARLAATGVGALVVGPYTPPPPGRTGPMDEIAALRAETRRHGLRIVVDLHPPRGPQDDVLLLDCVRRWLDQDIDGVRISAGPEIGARHLDDLRHLLDGYEDRVLIRSGPPTAAGFRSEQGDLGAESDACDLLQPGSLTIAFVQGFGNGNLYTHAHRLRLALEVLRSSGLRAGWAHTLPDAIRPAQRRSAAAVLLGLPGVPLLPPDLLGDPAIATLLELRRAHPALSRGAFDVRPYTGLGLLAVVRTHGGETVLCLTNSGAEPATVDLTPGYLGVPGPLSLLDLLDGGTADCAGTAPARTVVDGGGVRWFLLLPAPGRAYPGTGPVAR
uniref:DUF3459 domain-containing protein n=1 Tax=Streptomyces clavuligerus TaxID=1901 RepID=UPI0018D05B27